MTDAQMLVTATAIDELLDQSRATIEPRVEPADLADMVASGGLLVDMRPDDQRIKDGLVPGALVIGRNVLEWRLDPTSPHSVAEVTGADQQIVLICDEGYSSSLAAAALRRLGLRHATDLAGGVQAWLEHRRRSEA